MIRKINYALTLLLVMIVSDLSAQNSQILQYMNLPQNHMINPALKQSVSFYAGLPVISGISMSLNNNFVNFSDVFMKGETGDSVISIFRRDYNIDKFLSKIKPRNPLRKISATVQLISFGFSIGKNGYIFLDINDRMEGNTILPGDLFALALKGNDQFVGGKIDLSSFRGDAKYYREAGLAFSTNLTNKFRIGIKGKLLFGIAGLSIDNRSLGISINNNYIHTLYSDLTVNLSAPVKININSDHNIQSIVFDNSRLKTFRGISDLLSGKGNTGFGLDLGATYDITERLMVSAAITDIGFIRWKKNVTNLLVKSQFEYGGLNVVDVINGAKTFEDLGKEMADSLNNAFNVTSSNLHFTDNLRYVVTLGGSYSFTKNFTLGVLSYRRVVNKQLRESVTFSASVKLSDIFSSSLSYTLDSHQYDKLGAGISFRTGIFQFYILSDRIPVMWNKIKIDKKNTITLPSNWNVIDLSLGINLVFGNDKRKQDKPMLTVE